METEAQDVLFLIFRHLTGVDLLSVLCSCRRFHDVILSRVRPPSSEDGRGLLFACKKGNLEYLKRWRNNWDPNLACQGQFALVEACRSGHAHIVEYMLQGGADPHVGQDASLLASVEHDRLECLCLLLKFGVNPEVVNQKDVLSMAAQEGHSECVRALLDAGADPLNDECIALRLAAQEGHLDIVVLLVKVIGPQVVIPPYAIQYAALGGYASVVAFLLQQPNIDCSADNHMALQWAAQSGHRVIVDMLLGDEKEAEQRERGVFLACALEGGLCDFVLEVLESISQPVHIFEEDNCLWRAAVTNRQFSVMRILVSKFKVDPCCCDNFAFKVQKAQQLCAVLFLTKAKHI